jgi:hypothetical protein
MRILISSSILLLLSSFITTYAAHVEITAANVDDRIDIYVDGNHQDDCTWGSNPGCYAGIKGNLYGTNDIRFKLTNYVYEGFCMFGGCGKYAADLSIRSNGRTIWSKSIYRRNNSYGVKYDQTIRCNFSTNDCWER